MATSPGSVLSLTSGDPWNLSCTVESIGPDYLCRIHGGDRHIGAIAVSHWNSNRAVTEKVVVPGHREATIAAYAAHNLCRASRKSVICIAGIHFDDINRRQIDEIVQDCFTMTRRGTKQIEERRLRHELQSASGLYSEITAQARNVESQIDRFFSAPLDDRLRAVRLMLVGPRHARRAVRIFAPLYLSNACSNDCAYCGFRKSARIRRSGLGPEQIVAEARHLARQGHRTIDLVTGEVPTDLFVDQVCHAVESILRGSKIRHINLNLGALTLEQFRRLRSAGAAGYHLYQETYDPDVYFEAHRSGPKREMAYRLEAPARAIEAGFERIGLGVLLGLRPLRQDLAHLVRHARLLGKSHPRVSLGFSLPRIQMLSDGCGYEPAAPVGDEDFIKAMLFLRVNFPQADLTLTTRERPEIRDILLPLGVSKVSAGVSTAPGGYASADRKGAPQFPVSDGRSVGAIADAIRGAGLRPTFG